MVAASDAVFGAIVTIEYEAWAGGKGTSMIILSGVGGGEGGTASLARSD